MTAPGLARLTTWERAGLVLAGVFLIAFAGVVELRGAFQKTRKTDLGVYLRAAYAVRTGADIYQATDNNGYHYTYPPAFAVLLVPFADAPTGVPRDGLPPFWLGVALWTLLNYLLVGRIVHVLATLVLPDAERGSRRWWYARTIPVYATIGGLGHSISMGQVNVVLAALIVEMIRASLEGKRLQSGLWLAAAISMKVIPAYLLLYPLLKRDVRAGAGVAIGLVLGLGVVPVAGLGLGGTVDAYRSFADRVLFPGAKGGGENAALPELMWHSSECSRQTFLGVIHSFQYPDRRTMPPLATPEAHHWHNLLSLAVTLLAAGVIARRGLKSATDCIIGGGTLLLLMAIVNPMSHIHYMGMGLPLTAGLWLKAMAREPDRLLPRRTLAVLAVWMLGVAVPMFPGETFRVMRYHGVPMAAALVLSTTGLISLWRREAIVESPDVLPFERPAAWAARKAA